MKQINFYVGNFPCVLKLTGILENPDGTKEVCDLVISPIPAPSAPR